MNRQVIVLMFAGLSAMTARSAQSQTPRLEGTAKLDSTAIKERANFLWFVDALRHTIVDAADAMPDVKYGFAPTEGEFANVRTFSKQVRHLAATNYILAAAALGQRPPADAGDETGPDSVVTKAQHVAYLRGSFDALERAARAIGDASIPVGSSPISPFQGGTATRVALLAEAMIHAYDHYGQMVVYLRMNGVIPPASRR